MDREELNKILEEHRKWLGDEKGGKRADLQGAYLKYAVLKFEFLQDANLQDADLQSADLQFAFLEGAILNGADLQRTDLKYTDIRNASIQGANIDYSCWPLWCGSLGVKVDPRIARQLMYHALSVICDDPEFLTIRNNPDVLAFVNKFHRVEMGDCPELEPIELAKGKEI